MTGNTLVVRIAAGVAAYGLACMGLASLLTGGGWGSFGENFLLASGVLGCLATFLFLVQVAFDA